MGTETPGDGVEGGLIGGEAKVGRGYLRPVFLVYWYSFVDLVSSTSRRVFSVTLSFNVKAPGKKRRLTGLSKYLGENNNFALSR